MKKFRKVVPEKIKASDLKPLDVTCGATKCDENLHCFSRYVKQAQKKFGKKGVCHNCGEDSIDWNRMHKNDIQDSQFMFTSLKKELIRNIFWNVKIDKLAVENALKSNKTDLRTKAKKDLKARIKKYNAYIDNQQTPLGKGNIVNYAQHATATCCRACLEAWHNIPKQQELTDSQLEFCTDLVMKFIDERLPEIPEKQ